jgi:hypothetical protein
MIEHANSSQLLSWDKADLVQRLCRALDVADGALDCLAKDGYTDPKDPSNDVRPEKVISETAFLLIAASTVPGCSDVTERIDRVARSLIPHARSERMLIQTCLHTSLALDFAQAHICLARLGYSDHVFDKLLCQSCQAQGALGRERVPHRVLEQEWIARSWACSEPDSRKYSSRTRLISVLNHPVDLFGGSREDFYAFTHALMYLRDFNIHPVRLPRRRSELLAEAGAMLARCLDEQDYDLGGELLLAWPLTGRSWGATASFGFRVLAKVEDRAGFLPASSTRLDRLQKLEGKARRSYLLATAYHTMYVMGLLCAVALQPGRNPPAFISDRGARPGGAEPILEVIDSIENNAHWREQIEVLSREERDAVSSLLLNIALIRAMKKRQFTTVRNLLEIADAQGLSDSPCSSQAAEALERVSVFASITAKNEQEQTKQIESEEALAQHCSVSGH